MILYKKLSLIRVAEFHFDESDPGVRADIVRHYWRSAPVPGAPREEGRTLVFDLTSSAEVLLANMHANRRYQIRRAEKDGFEYDFWQDPGTEILDRFCNFYKEFAAVKHLPPANRDRLAALLESGALDLSYVSDKAHGELVWHAHYCTGERARGIYSASLLGRAAEPALRSLVGRANCYHTWRDMLRFQQRGLSVYDLGGWYSGNEDQEKLRVNTFKEEFGGVLVEEFTSEIGATAIGKLALALKAAGLSLFLWYHSRLRFHALKRATGPRWRHSV